MEGGTGWEWIVMLKLVTQVFFLVWALLEKLGGRSDTQYQSNQEQEKMRSSVFEYGGWSVHEAIRQR